MNLNNIVPEKISFNTSLSNHKEFLNKSIYEKRILVIGGAGTIGSSYIKQVLKFEPSQNSQLLILMRMG